MKKMITKAVVYLFATVALVSGRVGAIEPLSELSLEELLDMEVSSVAKKTQQLSVSPAAVYVVTGEDIKRSGVTNIPDALRLVPGVAVAQISANKWAIATRGFNGRFTNKLLVLMDGRSLYTPSFSGVYWEMQNTLMEDIERIEVIRGPGASVWGANAMNGVINIITKTSVETQGDFLQAGAGDKEGGFFSYRTGGELDVGEDTTGRLYVSAKRKGSFEQENGEDANDGWHSIDSGFRVDATRGAGERIVLQGGVQKADFDQHVELQTFPTPTTTFENTAETTQGHLLGRWTLPTDSGESTWQLYFDHFTRKEFIGTETFYAVDLEYQYRQTLAEAHDLIWGLGYRLIEDTFVGDEAYTILDPEREVLHNFSGFVQDEITVIDDTLWVTLGSKLEKNQYTGYEVQPSLRALWAIKPGHRLWGSVSRAVRTPSRIERRGTIVNGDYPLSAAQIGAMSANSTPAELAQLGALAAQCTPPGAPYVRVQPEGDEDFNSEEVTAWELGYRLRPTPKFFVDTALFYNDYKNLRGSYPLDPSVDCTPFGFIRILQPLEFRNVASAVTYGVELSSVLRLSDSVRVDFNFSNVFVDPEVDEPVDDSEYSERNTHRYSMTLNADITSEISFNTMLTYQDEVAGTNGRVSEPPFTYVVDDYYNLHGKVGWRPSSGVELAVVGRNLWSSEHEEYLHENYTPSTKIPRSIYLTVSIDY